MGSPPHDPSYRVNQNLLLEYGRVDMDSICAHVQTYIWTLTRHLWIALLLANLTSTLIR